MLFILRTVEFTSSFKRLL